MDPFVAFFHKTYGRGGYTVTKNKSQMIGHASKWTDEQIYNILFHRVLI
jgi:hypothetical protein